LAGQCSKLKCCLSYELDCYTDARQEFPRIIGPLQALDADYFHIKSDILARTMSFSTQPGSMAGMVTLSVGRVKEIMRLNAEGKKPEKITSDTIVDTTTEEPTYINVIGEDSITRFDKSKRKKKKNNKSKGSKQGGDQKGGESKGGDQKASEPKEQREPKAPKEQREPRESKAPKQGGDGERKEGERKEGERREGERRDGNRGRNNRGRNGGRSRGGQPRGERKDNKEPKAEPKEA
jgi:hypothetical protein